jgi:hypothetical protein
MDVFWKREIGMDDLRPAVKRYRRYLEDLIKENVTGLRELRRAN